MKTVQLSDNELRAIDGDELRRLIERCYVPRTPPRRKDERDDLFGDTEILHGHLSTLAELSKRLDTIPSAGVAASCQNTPARRDADATPQAAPDQQEKQQP